ncbi:MULTISPECIES: ornithine cyclodeaminase family protein [Moraxella]|uniref:Ornithine cyclodeaminase n=1 Tax=Moraxella catarrhalis TaxID=480 RepID=A0A198UFP5_MORCA|nr:ornithine cyclodeaminase family protein [Moraxella catarrhalis]OAU95170.1 Ornithine cyclodeaminase [Moraxella catarrhalis]OAU98926.1 Ornithine cyclodeaminase [Moraxella catarrhalis]OAU99228.1 Ornithine cyclodeaminase [Moraxella catarrhalis]OAV00041.1 Ornithine cyclodeaminase [Moraxella catarrhalis]STY82468.1 ornithine cyclodeaminase [Moraxella catarrhalis]
MQFYNTDQTIKALPAEQLIAAIEHLFIQGCDVPLRHNHAIQNGNNEEVGRFLIMPAWQPGRRLGLKTVSIFPNNNQQGLAGLHSVYILYDANTGVPIAIFDGNTITSRRTAAASALAARFLSRPDSHRLLVVGAGQVGRLLPEMYKAVRPIEEVSIFNPTLVNAEMLADKLTQDGFKVQIVKDLKAAVSQADIISCATLSTKPLIMRDWLQPGQHLDLIGSFSPEMRETDGKCFADTSVFMDTEEALMKAGDILSAIKEGYFDQNKNLGTLYNLCRSQCQGRTSKNEITVFKSVGTGLEDLAAANLAYDNLNQ